MDTKRMPLAALFLFCVVICSGTRIPKRPFYLRYSEPTPIFSGYSYKTNTFQQQVTHYTTHVQNHTLC